MLVEPFAAALHAVTSLNPPPGEQVAVLGPRRLGLLVVAAQADLVIRPSRSHQRSLVRPGGSILVHTAAALDSSMLVRAVVERGLRLSSSLCGDFRPALHLLANDPELRRLGSQLLTHRFGIQELGRAFEVARSRECIKAVVEHG